MRSLKDMLGQAEKSTRRRSVEQPPPVQGTLQFLQSENIRLKEEIEKLEEEVSQLRVRLRALCTLQEASMQISPHTNVMSLLERVLSSALLSIGASDGSLMLLDEATQELVFAVVHGQVKNSLVGHRIPLGLGIAGWVAIQKEPVVVEDVQQDPRFLSSVDQTFRFQTRSMVCVPVTAGDRVLGVLQALNKFEQRPFNQSDLTMMRVAAQLASTAITRAEAAVAAQDALAAQGMAPST